MSLQCVAPEAADDQMKPNKPTNSANDNPDGDLPSSTSVKQDGKYYPLVYREPEETPKHDSDDHLSDHDNLSKTRRSRRSLPLRYASHSSRDSSPASDTIPRTTQSQLFAPPKVRLSSVLAKRHHDGRTIDSPDNDDLDSKKRKEELMQSQRGNRQVFDRNKRMFGMLMGTLKRFKTEETSREAITLKRSKIDEKLNLGVTDFTRDVVREPPNCPGSVLRDDEQTETIDKAEMKLDILGRLKNWESSHRHMAAFIQTETRPKIFWLPKEHNPETEKQLRSTKDYYNLFMAERAAKCKKELEDLEKASLKSLIEAHQHSRESTSSPEGRRHRHRRISPREYRSPASDTSGSSGSFRR